MGWPKSPLSFFRTIKDTFLFWPITLLIWIFWVCQLSPTWYDIDCSQLMSWCDRYQLQLVYPTIEHCPGRNYPAWNSSSHFWHIWSVTARSLFTAQIFFSLHFYFSWNNKAQYAKNVVHFLPSSILKWLHKIQQFW